MPVPRDNMTRGLFLRAHAARVKLLEPVGLLPRDWREWTCHDLSRCTHTQMEVHEVTNAHGGWAVEICNNCGTQVSRHCVHLTSSWNEEGTVLTCDNCGIDGT